jgi:hypothetical protein
MTTPIGVVPSIAAGWPNAQPSSGQRRCGLVEAERRPDRCDRFVCYYGSVLVAGETTR